jgi:hypothetical protein
MEAYSTRQNRHQDVRRHIPARQRAKPQPNGANNARRVGLAYARRTARVRYDAIVLAVWALRAPMIGHETTSTNLTVHGLIQALPKLATAEQHRLMIVAGAA